MGKSQPPTTVNRPISANMLGHDKRGTNTSLQQDNSHHIEGDKEDDDFLEEDISLRSENDLQSEEPTKTDEPKNLFAKLLSVSKNNSSN